LRATVPETAAAMLLMEKLLTEMLLTDF